MTSRLVGLLLLCAVWGCKPSGAGKGTPSAAPPRPSQLPSASVLASAPPSPPPPPRGCRAVVLTGSVQRLNGGPLRPGELFDGAAWLDFAEGASATFRHAESTREWTFVGPGRMRPCRGGDEQIAIASGRLKTSTGAGARPGAEVLVFTPHGVLRYGDATLDLTVDQRRLSVLPKIGQVWLETLEGKTAELALPLGKAHVATSKRPASLEQRCEALAQRASELGTALTSGAKSGPELSSRAVEHMKARREARFACGAGESFAAGLEPPERGRLLDRLAELEQRYRAFPKNQAAPNP